MSDSKMASAFAVPLILTFAPNKGTEDKGKIPSQAIKPPTY